MTEKQKIFADEYLIDLNATRAYKVAYPNVKKDGVARANASRLLTNANVKKYISDQMDQIHCDKIANAQEVMEYLTSVLRGESTGHEIVVEGVGEGMSEARMMEKKPSEKEKLKAAELLGRRYSLFTEKVEVSGSLEAEKTKLDDLIQQMRGGDG
ncbi:terminase small subunit [Brotaphodocola sp.]|uniref:terminase small subunit n=1 Tax=Brotaphodocola sp. TaxID=3073577 RepID=UPI003D7E4E8E